MTVGAGSGQEAGRLRTQMSTAQMARHCGHQRKRLPLCMFMRTSTGEHWHSGHDTSTSSGVFITRVLSAHRESATHTCASHICIRCHIASAGRVILRWERATCAAGRNNQAGRVRMHTRGGVEPDAPAGIGTPAPRGVSEHLGCQRGRVQTPAGARIGSTNGGG
jgi:hypothetical protein